MRPTLISKTHTKKGGRGGGLCAALAVDLRPLRARFEKVFFDCVCARRPCVFGCLVGDFVRRPKFCSLPKTHAANKTTKKGTSELVADTLTLTPPGVERYFGITVRALCVFVRGDEAILVCCSVRRSLKPQTPNKNAHTTQKTKQRGHIHHIDNGFGFDQRFPYRVPHIDGLYSASAGAHPAGSVIGCAGHNAAGVLVRDLGLVPKWATAAE